MHSKTLALSVCVCVKEQDSTKTQRLLVYLVHARARHISLTYVPFAVRVGFGLARWTDRTSDQRGSFVPSHRRLCD